MVVIDRFEENLVVIEMNMETYILPRALFPSNSEEGDVINISISVDKEETSRILKEMTELRNEILKNSEKNL